MHPSDSHEHGDLSTAANDPIRLVGVIGCRLGGLLACLVDSVLNGTCGAALVCRLDGLMAVLVDFNSGSDWAWGVDSESESDVACGEVFSCWLGGLLNRFAGLLTQVCGCFFGDPLVDSVESDSESV